MTAGEGWSGLIQPGSLRAPVVSALLVLTLCSCVGRGTTARDATGAYVDFLEFLAAGDFDAAYSRLDSGTILMLESTVSSLGELGLSGLHDGRHFFELLVESSPAELDFGEPGPVFVVSDSVAEISMTGDLPADAPSHRVLRLQDGAWRVDLTASLSDLLDRQLSGTGLAAGDLHAPVSAPGTP